MSHKYCILCMVHIFHIIHILHIMFIVHIVPGQRAGVDKPGRIHMSLQAMKSVHEPVVVELAGMVQEP